MSSCADQIQSRGELSQQQQFSVFKRPVRRQTPECVQNLHTSRVMDVNRFAHRNKIDANLRAWACGIRFALLLSALGWRFSCRSGFVNADVRLH
jgi:hypothetical protein